MVVYRPRPLRRRRAEFYKQAARRVTVEFTQPRTLKMHADIKYCIFYRPIQPADIEKKIRLGRIH